MLCTPPLHDALPILQLVQAAGKETRSNEYLAFKLGQEEYGIGSLNVRKPGGDKSGTRTANAPDFIKGVINLRGIIVPIVDMRIKFNVGEPSYDQFTV